MKKQAMYAVIVGSKTVPINDLWQADEDFLRDIDGIEVYLPEGGKIDIHYRRSDGVLAVSGRDMEIMPRAANLIYIKDSGKPY